MVLHGMVTFDSFQSALGSAGVELCALSSSFQHTTVQMKHVQGRKGEKKSVWVRRQESDTITPSCQFACGPFSLSSHALIAPPAPRFLFGFQTVKSVAGGAE